MAGSRVLRVALIGLGLAVGSTACTLGPDPTRSVVTPADGADRFVNDARAVDDTEHLAAAVDHWWEGLADPVTTELVELTLERSTDIRQAAARVLEAEAGLARARGARWPHADLSLSANRTKTSFVLPGAGRVGIYSTTLSHDLSISYQVDLFGRLARSRQAAWAELLAAEADRRTVLHSVIAQVVRARVQVAGLEHRLDLARRTVSSWEQTVALVDERYRMGLVDPADVHLNRQSLAAARASVPELEQQLAAARHGLDVLVGRRPGTGRALPATLPRAPRLEPVPPGLPAALLDRRPDLVQARLQLQAATARIGVAMADLFPSLTLTGNLGARADSLSDLVSEETLVYSAVSSLLAPLFRGGQLRAEVRAARARAEQAAAAYSGAVLRALAEVEDALLAERAIAQRMQAHQVQLESARAAEELARSRYHAGTSGLLQLLIADRALVTAETALIQVHTAQWEARVALLLALGGDWLAPEDPAAADEPGAAGTDKPVEIAARRPEPGTTLVDPIYRIDAVKSAGTTSTIQSRVNERSS